ncbi:MAG TPA: ribonuclease HII [Verrucomicrobiales bacterium]|nr:ribonuclease HII [Verrucomicrobiales bacterium]
MACHLQHEETLWGEGCRFVAGLDEAGRGPLAGPVVAAAVVLPEDFDLPGLDDSKKLRPEQRQRLYEALIADTRVVWACGRAEVEEIDRLNILRASWLAMERALQSLPRSPDCVLVDGLQVPVLRYRQWALVGGDGISLSIAAASVIAKVVRDEIMIEFGRRHPGYGFEWHKGYGTKKHLACLARLGPCPLHRRSFRPVAQLTFDFGD